jgi:hypothetical protein
MLGVVAFLLLVRALLERAPWSASRAGTTPAALPLRSESSGDGWQTLQAEDGALHRSGASSVSARSAADPCHEVIDHFSGIYINHCSSRAPPNPPGAVEIRKQQQLADEAIKVLEATTPEM